jgi:hypothetical protein
MLSVYWTTVAATLGRAALSSMKRIKAQLDFLSEISLRCCPPVSPSKSWPCWTLATSSASVWMHMRWSMSARLWPWRPGTQGLAAFGLLVTVGCDQGGNSRDGGSSPRDATAGDSAAQCASDCEHDCCDGACVALGNDPRHCGSCGKECMADAPVCRDGQCVAPDCADAGACTPGSCCGSECCGSAQHCCYVPGAVGMLTCVEAAAGGCPIGCPDCQCLPGGTLIATGRGEQAVEKLHVGDLVYTVHEGATVLAPLLAVNRVPVTNHQVVHVQLRNGMVLQASGRHPLADGRSFAALTPGAMVDGLEVVSAELVLYDQPFTYDVLPASDTGVYFIGGIAVGSTLFGRAD